MGEIKQIAWNKNEHNTPKKSGWYLCKICDLISYDENGKNCEWSKPYYDVVWFGIGGYWDCDGVPIAWAEIPECSFDVE